MSKPSDIDSARQTYAAVLRALDTAARWQKQEMEQTEDECSSALKSAETTRKQAEDKARQMREDGTKQANKIRATTEDLVTHGENLYQHANLGKNKPILNPPPPLLPPVSPGQALQRAQSEAKQAIDNLQRGLDELERARVANMLQRRNLIIAGAILLGMLLLVIFLLI